MHKPYRIDLTFFKYTFLGFEFYSEITLHRPGEEITIQWTGSEAEREHHTVSYRNDKGEYHRADGPAYYYIHLPTGVETVENCFFRESNLQPKDNYEKRVESGVH